VRPDCEPNMRWGAERMETATARTGLNLSNLRGSIEYRELQHDAKIAPTRGWMMIDFTLYGARMIGRGCSPASPVREEAVADGGRDARLRGLDPEMRRLGLYGCARWLELTRDKVLITDRYSSIDAVKHQAGARN